MDSSSLEDIVKLREQFGDLKAESVIEGLDVDSLEFFLQDESSLSVCREISRIQSLRDSVLCSVHELHEALVALQSSQFDDNKSDVVTDDGQDQRTTLSTAFTSGKD